MVSQLAHNKGGSQTKRHNKTRRSRDAFSHDLLASRKNVQAHSLQQELCELMGLSFVQICFCVCCCVCVCVCGAVGGCYCLVDTIFHGNAFLCIRFSWQEGQRCFHKDPALVQWPSLVTAMLSSTPVSSPVSFCRLELAHGDDPKQLLVAPHVEKGPAAPFPAENADEDDDTDLFAAPLAEESPAEKSDDPLAPPADEDGSKDCRRWSDAVHMKYNCEVMHKGCWYRNHC